MRIAPAGTEVRNPAFDVTPAELISGIVTEEGILRPPFEAGLRAAHDAAIARWAAVPGHDRPVRVDRRGRGAGGRLMATVAVGRRSDVVARTTTDRALLRDFLERDRLYAAYALCDLEEREFGRTRWGVAADGDENVSLVLEYNGPTPQPLFVMGRPDGIDAILRDRHPAARRLRRDASRGHARGRGPLPRRRRAADGPHVGRPGPLPPVSGLGRRGSCRSTSPT